MDYFIDDSFVFNFIVELRHIFGVYKQHDIVKFLHNLVLYRYNTFNVLENVKNILEKNLDLEIYMMKKQKVEKMNSIDDVMKYIEGEQKHKTKKKKKKKKK